MEEENPPRPDCSIKPFSHCLTMEAFGQHWSIKDPVGSERRGVSEFVLSFFFNPLCYPLRIRCYLPPIWFLRCKEALLTALRWSSQLGSFISLNVYRPKSLEVKRPGNEDRTNDWRGPTDRMRRCHWTRRWMIYSLCRRSLSYLVLSPDPRRLSTADPGNE